MKKSKILGVKHTDDVCWFTLEASMEALNHLDVLFNIYETLRDVDLVPRSYTHWVKLWPTSFSIDTKGCLAYVVLTDRRIHLILRKVRDYEGTIKSLEDYFEWLSPAETKKHRVSRPADPRRVQLHKFLKTKDENILKSVVVEILEAIVEGRGNKDRLSYFEVDLIMIATALKMDYEIKSDVLNEALNVIANFEGDSEKEAKKKAKKLLKKLK